MCSLTKGLHRKQLVTNIAFPVYHNNSSVHLKKLVCTPIFCTIFRNLMSIYRSYLDSVAILST